MYKWHLRFNLNIKYEWELLFPLTFDIRCPLSLSGLKDNVHICLAALPDKLMFNATFVGGAVMYERKNMFTNYISAQICLISLLSRTSFIFVPTACYFEACLVMQLWILWGKFPREFVCTHVI